MLVCWHLIGTAGKCYCAISHLWNHLWFLKLFSPPVFCMFVQPEQVSRNKFSLYIAPDIFVMWTKLLWSFPCVNTALFNNIKSEKIKWLRTQRFNAIFWQQKSLVISRVKAEPLVWVGSFCSTSCFSMSQFKLQEATTNRRTQTTDHAVFCSSFLYRWIVLTCRWMAFLALTRSRFFIVLSLLANK